MAVMARCCPGLGRSGLRGPADPAGGHSARAVRVPDAPPYDSYDGMSEAQIVDVEMTCRMLDTEWETKPTG